jgi:hypothetical protein
MTANRPAHGRKTTSGKGPEPTHRTKKTGKNKDNAGSRRKLFCFFETQTLYAVQADLELTMLCSLKLKILLPQVS